MANQSYDISICTYHIAHFGTLVLNIRPAVCFPREDMAFRLPFDGPLPFRGKAYLHCFKPIHKIKAILTIDMWLPKDGAQCS